MKVSTIVGAMSRNLRSSFISEGQSPHRPGHEPRGELSRFAGPALGGEQVTRRARTGLSGFFTRPSATSARATPTRVSPCSAVHWIATPAGHQGGKSNSTESAGSPAADGLPFGARVAHDLGAPAGALDAGSY